MQSIIPAIALKTRDGLSDDPFLKSISMQKSDFSSSAIQYSALIEIIVPSYTIYILDEITEKYKEKKFLRVCNFTLGVGCTPSHSLKINKASAKLKLSINYVSTLRALKHDEFVAEI